MIKSRYFKPRTHMDGLHSIKYWEAIGQEVFIYNKDGKSFRSFALLYDLGLERRSDVVEITEEEMKNL